MKNNTNPKGTDIKMLAGISTACLYPQHTEVALARLAASGVTATEVFLNSPSELEPAFLKELRRTADDAGVKILSVHPFTSAMEPMFFFSSYRRRFEDGKEYYKQYYQAANILGGDIVVFHGNVLQLPIGQDEYVARFAGLMEDAKSQGVRLCHENVSRCSGRSPAFFREMRRQLPQAGFVLDVKQALRSGETVETFLQAMGGNISHIHISDHTDSQDCLSIGKGTFNIPEFLATLASEGYAGGVVVELYRENFGAFVELLEGYQLLSAYISTV